MPERSSDPADGSAFLTISVHTTVRLRAVQSAQATGATSADQNRDAVPATARAVAKESMASGLASIFHDGQE